jgi:hypothetical protein
MIHVEAPIGERKASGEKGPQCRDEAHGADIYCSTSIIPTMRRILEGNERKRHVGHRPEEREQRSHEGRRETRMV